MNPAPLSTAETKTLSVPTISVIVCAYTLDRWADLDAAVESVLGQRHPAVEVVLVIDHNDALLRRATERFTPSGVRVVANAAGQGLSGARNTGVQLAVGDVLAFLDDDAVAAADWLGRLAAGYADPQVLGVGGSAAPAWPTARPGWFPTEFDWVVGCSYTGQPEQVEPVRNFLGCNMSLRREVFAAVGGFSAEIGRVGRIPLGCEETELCIRSRRIDPDGVLLYAPSAQVRHRVSADRVAPAYFFRRCYAEGLSKAVVTELVGAEQGLGSERRYTSRVLPAGVLRALGRALSPRRVTDRRAAAIRAGAIVAGLTVTVLGYARGRLRIASGRQRVDTTAPVLTMADRPATAPTATTRPVAGVPLTTPA